MSSHKIAFIINPKAGVKKKINLEEFITSNFPKSIPYDIIVWKNKDDFNSIQKAITQNNYTIVVACGGDGTVNKVASCLINTNSALGILPLGSGNGLARSLGIPMDLKQALNFITQNKQSQIDVGYINSTPFFCTAGIGFDAYIANLFATSTKRGMSSYVQMTLSSYFSYQPHIYNITIDGKIITTKALLVTVANAGQWGNNVYIAPGAKLNDGLFHVSILSPLSLINMPSLGLKLLSKKIDTSSKLQSIAGKRIDIEFEGELPIHYDGEPSKAQQKISFELQPLALKVLSKVV